MPNGSPLSSTPVTTSAAPTKGGAGDVGVIIRTLEGIRRRAWLLLLVAGVAVIVGIAGAILWSAALIDFYLRGPAMLRLALLILSLIGLWVLIRRQLSPVFAFKPSLTELALRLERTPEGKKAGLEGILASGLELASRLADRRTDAARAGRAVEEALTKFRSSNAATHVLRGRAAWRAVGIAAILVLPGLVLAMWRPDLARIGIERILTPWTGAAWPRRTHLADVTGIAAHSSRSSLPVRAVVRHTYGGGYTPDVWVKFRTIVDGRAGEWRRELLTPQGRQGNSIDGSISGDLVERLIEPAPEAREGVDLATAIVEVEYGFISTDDETGMGRIRLVEPPVIVRTELDVELPAYAASLCTGSAVGAFVSGRQEIPEGSAITSVGSVLAGSRVTVHAILNKTVAAPAAGPGPMFSGEAPADASLVASGSRWTLSFTAEESARISLLLEDEFGIPSPSEVVLALSVLADQPPSAAVLTPAQDEGVLPTATVGIIGEGRDDVGLSWTGIEHRLVRGLSGSLGAAAPAGSVVELSRWSASDAGATGGLEARVEASLKLETLSVKPGDEVVLAAVAKDGFLHDGAEHEVVSSAPRRLLVISEAQLTEQVRSELAAVRDSAIRLDRDQDELTRRAAQLTAGQQESAQRSITQRLSPPAELLERLAQRVERNGVSDQALGGMLKDAGETLEAAAKASEEAAEALERSDRKTAAGEDPAEEDRQAKTAQDDVREELARVVGMLDRGQDAWTVRREVQRLASQQRELLEQTQDAGQSTAGKPADALTQQERERLAQLAQRQQELSARTEAAIESLEERAKALEQSDPGQAAAMKQAAQQARQQKTTAGQRRAAQDIKDNRTQSANELQEKAAEALEQMLQQFDQSERQRDEALRRVLAELAQQIEALIAQQNSEIEALAGAGSEPAAKGLDAGMISLHSATLGLADSVRDGARETRPIASPLSAASDAQRQAISELRRPTASADKTREHEQASLTRLREAQELASKLDEQAQQRDQTRQRGQILEAYRAALEEQSVIAAETAPIVGKALDRRQRATARALGEREEALRATLEELRKKNTDIEDTIIFSYAHDQLDGLLKRAADALRGGGASKGTQRDQASAVTLLKSLVQALAASSQSSDPFREGADEGQPQEDGGGGGAGGAGGNKPKLIPEIAELQGLRGLQEIARDRTRAASEAGAEAADDELADLQKFQREIADKAKKLIEKFNNPENGPPPPEGDAKPENGDQDQPQNPPNEQGAQEP